MKDEILVSGKTVAEAWASASEQFGSLGDVSFETVQEAKKGFLGFGAAPAKVRVVFNGPVRLPDVLGSNVEIVTVKTERDLEKEAAAAAAPAEEKTEPKADRPQRSDRPRNDRGPKKDGAKPQQHRDQAPKAPKVEEAPAAEVAPVEAEPEKVYTPVESDVAEKSDAYRLLAGLIANTGTDAVVEMSVAEDGEKKLVIAGEGASTFIGHHGETLDALQYLANLAENKKEGSSRSADYSKVILDIENYRNKREETLRALARRMSAKALKYKRNVVLEPMNPYERRIIHSEVQKIENVSTHSVGSDTGRKIVITYEGTDAAPRRGGRGGRGGRRGGNRQDRPDRADRAEQATTADDAE